LVAMRLDKTHLDGFGDVDLGILVIAGKDARDAGLKTSGDDARVTALMESDRPR